MRTPQHIVMPVRALPHHSIGGMQAAAWDLATAFAQRNMEVTVLTAEIPGKPASFEDSGVRVRTLCDTNWRRYGARWWSSTRKAFEQEFRESCDLVLSVSAGGFGLLPLRRHMQHIPFVLQAHGTSLGEVISKWHSSSFTAMATSIRNVANIPVDLRAYESFDAIVAVGKRVLADFSRWPYRHTLARGRVELIRNGIDTTLFRPDPCARSRIRSELCWSEDVKVVISASRLHKQKGIHLGLEAFAVLADSLPDARYLIVGDGDELWPLKKQASSLAISERVHFVGGVPRDRIQGYLNAADVMLFTTTHVEGEPLNVLEALAVGLPVVASRHLYPQGPPNDHVIPVRPRESLEVSAALRRAFAMLAHDRQSALPKGYSMAEAVQAYLGLFHRLLDGRIIR